MRGFSAIGRFLGFAQPQMPAHYGKFIGYYRVSTDKQGKSGLGLEAEKEPAVAAPQWWAWQMVGEFVEIESQRVPRGLNSMPPLQLARSTRQS